VAATMPSRPVLTMKSPYVAMYHCVNVDSSINAGGSRW
jgi:hypothetical protein